MSVSKNAIKKIGHRGLSRAKDHRTSLSVDWKTIPCSQNARTFIPVITYVVIKYNTGYEVQNWQINLKWTLRQLQDTLVIWDHGSTSITDLNIAT